MINYKQTITGLRLARAGLYGHFKANKKQLDNDLIWLDIRQFRRLIRAEDKQRMILVSGLRLWRAGLSGQFGTNRRPENIDAVWLDMRQFRRLIREEKHGRQT